MLLCEAGGGVRDPQNGTREEKLETRFSNGKQRKVNILAEVHGHSEPAPTGAP